MLEKNSTTEKQTVIYVRVSTTEQADEGNSLKWQEKACREYADKKGYVIPDGAVFIEAGESAKTADRTELKKMLTYCTNKKNKIVAVIVYKIDRLSRNTDDYGQIRILLKRYGISIKSATELIEDTPLGRFMENLMANVAEFDNGMRAERCSAGMKDAMREGRYVWMAPVGLKNTTLGEKADIVPNDMAKSVLRSFELVATGLYPVDEVRRIMIKEGLATKSGKPISKQYFYEMLQNILYTGWMIKFGEKHKANYGSVVPDELFLQVQRVMKNKGHKVGQYKTDNPEFPLRKFVFHPSGIKVTGSFAKGKYPHYRFTGIKGNYRRDDFQTDFMVLMDKYAFEKNKIEKLKHFIREKFHKATENERREADKSRRYLEELNQRQTAIIQKNLKGILNDSILKQQLDIIEDELTKTHASMAMLGNTDISAEEAIEYAEGYLLYPSSVWKKSKISTQIKLQWFQFPTGVTYDGQIFGTPKVSSVFKAKDLISTSKSDNVVLF